MAKRILLFSCITTIILSLSSCDKSLNEAAMAPTVSPSTENLRKSDGTGGPLTKSASNSDSKKKAIIISGGGDMCSNLPRYWNDCSFFYKTVKNVYGLEDNDIFVAMSDGTDPAWDRDLGGGYHDSSPLDLDGDGDGDIDYAATKSQVQQLFVDVSDKVDPGYEVIIFVADHGDCDNSGNQVIILWNGDTMNVSEFRTELDKLGSTVTKHIVMGQCYSGGFISGMQGLKQSTLATACSGTQLSYPLSGGQYDEFLYYWTAAIGGQYPDGSPANADANNDGVVSIREAFNFAQSNDIQSETPQFYEYKSLFGHIPIFYEYDFQEPYVTGPKDLNRGQSYVFSIVNHNPDFNPVTLVSNSDLTFVSSTDSTIVVSVNSTGGMKHGPIHFGVTTSPYYMNATCALDDVVIWQPGTFVDDMDAIQPSLTFGGCFTGLATRFSDVCSTYNWHTASSNWRVVGRLLPGATFQYQGAWPPVQTTLDVTVDVTNPFGNVTTLTKVVDLQ